MAHFPKIVVFVVLICSGTLLIPTPPALAQPVSFLPAVTYDSGGYSPTAVAVGDVNGDGIPDIAVSNLCVIGETCPNGQAYVCFSTDYCSHGATGVLLGNGDGSFQPAVTYESSGYLSYSVALGDLNGDRNLDLVVVNACGSIPDLYSCPSNGTFDVRFGNGDGTFGSPWDHPLQGWFPVSVVLGDVNGDDRLDVAVAHVCRTKSVCDVDCTCPSGSVQVLVNSENGFWGSQFDSGAPWGRSVALADVNRDGWPDVLMANSGAVGVLLGNGDGSFQPAMTYGSGGAIMGFSWSVAAADVSGDAKPDLLTAAGDVLLGGGNGTFQSGTQGSFASQSMAVSDVNGDSTPDLVLGGSGGSGVGVLLGKGDGTFQAGVRFDSGGQWPNSTAVGDFNGDGRPDVAVSHLSGVGVLMNDTRFCATAPVITMSITPTYLRPPNGKVIPVSVSGRITEIDDSCTTRSAAYIVQDEYGEVQPRGPVTWGIGGDFSFVVPLPASRCGGDIEGRRYVIFVGATNNADKTASQAGNVIVPHDQGR